MKSPFHRVSFLFLEVFLLESELNFGLINDYQEHVCRTILWYHYSIPDMMSDYNTNSVVEVIEIWNENFTIKPVTF